MSVLSTVIGIPGHLWATVRIHKKKSIAAGLTLLGIIFIVRSANAPKKPEYVTAPVVRGDLVQTVEAVGEVTSERELDLRFATSGVVSRVYVKEGDVVKAGQRLADLRAGPLAASVAAQAAALQSAQADLNALEQGTRPEEIAIAEADLRGKQAALEVARSSLKSASENLAQSETKLQLLLDETKVNLAGQVTTALSLLNQQLVSAENALVTIDDVLSDVDVQDAMIKDRPDAGNSVQIAKRAAQDQIDQARRSASSALDYQSALAALDQAISGTQRVTSALDSLFSVINSIRETSNFTSTERESVKSSISAQRSAAQTAATNVSTGRSTLQNASAAYDSKISAEQSNLVSYRGTRDRANTDILTYEASIQASQAQLALKKAGARQTDIDAARARVRQAQANVARASAELSDTVLTAPIDGTVTHVNVKGGESVPTGAAVALLGNSPFRVEMFVSEIDIPKVQRSQSGSIELDAFRGVHMKLHVSEVDSAATDKDGVSKYRVKLDFVHLHNEFKIGMTGDAEIETARVDDVVSIPRRAVIESGTGSMIVRVLKSDQTVDERPVTLGIEGGSGDVEVKTGVMEGETVIVLVK